MREFSNHFNPSRIFVDEAVKEEALTQSILQKFPKIPTEIVSDPKILKKPSDMTWAKKGLFLARMKADPLKEFKALTKSLGAMNGAPTTYYSLDLISNCHLECTYCILQSYLENNPVITIYTNMSEILDRLQKQLDKLPEGSFVGTGRIADSLALDDISEHSQFLIPFFAKIPPRPPLTKGGWGDSHFLELKTKSSNIKSLLSLDHSGKTVVSWSMNPTQIIEREEYKTASFEERLEAACQVSEAGYPVSFHFDPMIIHERWRENYAACLEKIFEKIPSERIFRMSVGILRFPARQAAIMKQRFPKNESVLEGLVSTNRTFIHYPDDLRQEMQGWMESEIQKHLPANQLYRCMDFG